MKITRGKIRLLIKENLNEGIVDGIEKIKIESHIKKEIKNGKLTNTYIDGLEKISNLEINLMTPDGELVTMTEKIGSALADYLNKKVKFEYKNGKVILTNPKISFDSKEKYHRYEI